MTLFNSTRVAISNKTFGTFCPL